MWSIQPTAVVTKVSSISGYSVRAPNVWLGQISRFAVVGAVATLVHVSVALLVTSVFALAPLVANLAGFCVAVAVSFWGHLWVTFRVKEPRRQHLYRFIVLSLTSLSASSLITATLTYLGGSMFVAMSFVTLIVPGVSFFAAKLWAFATITAQAGVLESKNGEPS